MKSWNKTGKALNRRNKQKQPRQYPYTFLHIKQKIQLYTLWIQFSHFYQTKTSLIALLIHHKTHLIQAHQKQNKTHHSKSDAGPRLWWYAVPDFFGVWFWQVAKTMQDKIAQWLHAALHNRE